MIKCNECKSGPLKGGLYVGDKGPLCNACYHRLSTCHTLGPWEVLELPELRCASARISAMGEVVAHATPLSSRPERDANARLIAAAPELLEMLKTVLKLGVFKGVEETRGVGIYSHRNGLWDKAQDLIAKAEGRRTHKQISLAAPLNQIPPAGKSFK